MKRVLLALAFGCASLAADPVFDFSLTSVGSADYNYSGVPLTVTARFLACRTMAQARRQILWWTALPE